MQTQAPAPKFPERPGTVFERELNVTNPTREGRLRFQEGVASDTDVPKDFAKGAMQGYMTPPGHPNHNMNVFEKPAAETMAERAHVGSASWVDAPAMLSEFSGSAFDPYSAPSYFGKMASGHREERPNAARVTD